MGPLSIVENAGFKIKCDWPLKSEKSKTRDDVMMSCLGCSGQLRRIGLGIISPVSENVLHIRTAV